MARELRIYERPALERPVLVSAFRGWNDGGQAATLAAGYLARLWGADKFADIDPELFVDFQATRPHVSLDEGQTRRIDWPENTFYRARIPGTNRDAVLLVGVEPNYRWRTFSELISGLAADLGGELAEAESTYVEQVSEAVSSDNETAAYVEELEQRADSLDWLEDSGSLPSGEALAAEIARFLRERERDGGSGS